MKTDPTTAMILAACADEGYDGIPEYRFHPSRKWRFDIAFPRERVAFEIEGGTWSGGRHTRGKGYEGDCEKYNHAAIDGWYVIRATTSMIKSGAALEQLLACLKARG